MYRFYSNLPSMIDFYFYFFRKVHAQLLLIYLISDKYKKQAPYKNKNKTKKQNTKPSI